MQVLIKWLLFISGFFLLSCEKPTFLVQSSIHNPYEEERIYGPIHEEWFVLKNSSRSKALDLLILVQNKASMLDRLNLFSESYAALTSELTDYDWQIAFSSADHGDHEDKNSHQNYRDYLQQTEGRFGGLMNLEGMNIEGRGGVLQTKILNMSMELKWEAFFHSLSHYPARDCEKAPYCSRGEQTQALRSLKTALLRSALDNRAFFRPFADFVAIILTNEPERSGDIDQADTAEMVLETFDKMFSHLDREKRFLSFGFLILDKHCLLLEREISAAANFSPEIEKLAEKTGGKNFSLCQQDYNRSLKTLSRQIRDSLENSILLKAKPVPGTIRLKFESPRLDWKSYGRKIVFKNRKQEEIRVHVSYEEL